MQRPGRIGRASLLLALVLTLVVVSASPAAAVSSYDARTTIVNTAIAQLGKPYVWAAAGPDAFDCSGLVQYCYGAAGIYVPHQSGILWSRCDQISPEDLQPGDLVFRADVKPPAVPTSAQIHHVAVYIGSDQVIEAPNKSNPVRYTSLSTFPYYGRLRGEYWPMGDSSYIQPPLLHGDFDGDGKDDLAFFYDQGGTTSAAYVATSTGQGFGVMTTWWCNPGRWDWKRTKVVAGDFNGDHKSDIAALYDYGGSTARIWVFLSDGGKFEPYPWWESPEGGFDAAGTQLVAADFDGDGRDDIGIFQDHGSRSRFVVTRSQGASFTAGVRVWGSGPTGWAAHATKVAAGDVTGDGKADLVMLTDAGGGASQLRVLTRSARQWTMQPAWWASAPGFWEWERAKLLVADVNGDRKSDVVMLYDYGKSTSRLWSFVSTGSGFGAVKVFWASSAGGWEWDRAKLGTGDFNGDGRADVLMVYDSVNAPVRAWTFPAKPDATAAGAAMAWDSSSTVDWNFVK